MLATLSKFKKCLTIAEEDTSQDEMLELHLAVASERIEKHCRRSYTTEAGDPVADLPRSVEQACLIYAVMLYNGQLERTSERVGDISVTLAASPNAYSLPPVILSLLSPYVLRGLG